MFNNMSSALRLAKPEKRKSQIVNGAGCEECVLSLSRAKIQAIAPNWYREKQKEIYFATIQIHNDVNWQSPQIQKKWNDRH